MENYKVQIAKEEILLSDLLNKVLGSVDEGGISIQEMIFRKEVISVLSETFREEGDLLQLEKTQASVLLSALLKVKFPEINDEIIDIAKEIQELTT